MILQAQFSSADLSICYFPLRKLRVKSAILNKWSQRQIYQLCQRKVGLFSDDIMCNLSIAPMLLQKESLGVLRKSCSEKMQQIYRRAPMPKCDFNKVAKQLY